MKGRVLRKLTACAVAAAMVLGMTVSVGAETAIGANGTATVAGGTTDTITIKKDVQVFNTSGHVIYSPKITFTYSVEPVTGLTDTTVTDGQGNKAVVRDGVAGVVSVKTNPDFGSDTGLHATSTDKTVTDETDAESIAKITKDIELNVNIAGITVPGIYRYKIKDTTTSAALTAAGISRPSGYNTDRYLDVYVVDDGSDGGVKIGGYVLFTATDGTVNIETTTVTTVVPGGEKTDGYVITSETEKKTTDEKYLEGNNKSDEYHTYNLKVTKDVTGDFGDRTHEFPFTVTTSGNTADYSAVAKDNSTSAEEKKTVASDTISTKIKNGESFTLYGLPNNTTYTIEETNDTKDTYKVTITDESAVSASATAPTPTPAILKAEASVKTNEKATLENQKTEDASLQNECISVKYTNNLESVTPTGIFLRYAPYIIMAAAAIILIVAMRRRKTED